MHHYVLVWIMATDFSTFGLMLEKVGVELLHLLFHKGPFSVWYRKFICLPCLETSCTHWNPRLSTFYTLLSYILHFKYFICRYV